MLNKHCKPHTHVPTVPRFTSAAPCLLQPSGLSSSLSSSSSSFWMSLTLLNWTCLLLDLIELVILLIFALANVFLALLPFLVGQTQWQLCTFILNSPCTGNDQHNQIDCWTFDLLVFALLSLPSFFIFSFFFFFAHIFLVAPLVPPTEPLLAHPAAGPVTLLADLAGASAP